MQFVNSFKQGPWIIYFDIYKLNIRLIYNNNSILKGSTFKY